MAELMKSYRGVRCVRCRNPIPVSASVLNRHEEIQHGQTTVSRTFIARCKLCECETVYPISDVQQFEGAPRELKSARRAAGAH